MKLYNSDCLEVMDKLISEGVKVDAIITDPPYGTTACKWDSVIPFAEMWPRLKVLRKDRTPIVLFGSEPFSSALRMSNIKEYKYDWIWEKDRITGFLNANFRPMLSYENISIFSDGGAGAGGKHKNTNMPYYPQGLIEVNKIKQNKPNQRGAHIHEGNNVGDKNCLNSDTYYVTKYKNYPKNILKISFMENEKRGLHPTQKPVKLMEYLIKTYTKEGDLVLDFTMGSGTTGLACKKLNRRFIGIEKDKKYFNIAKERQKKELKV